jgi:hypothetical protein
VRATQTLGQHDGQHLGVRGGTPCTTTFTPGAMSVRFGVGGGGGEGSAGARRTFSCAKRIQIHALLQRQEASGGGSGAIQRAARAQHGLQA